MRIRAIAKKLPRPVKNTLKAAYGAIPPRLAAGPGVLGNLQLPASSPSGGTPPDSRSTRCASCSVCSRIAMRTCPTIGRVFDERGLKPSQIQSLVRFAATAVPAQRADPQGARGVSGPQPADGPPRVPLYHRHLGPAAAVPGGSRTNSSGSGRSPFISGAGSATCPAMPGPKSGASTSPVPSLMSGTRSFASCGCLP